MKRALALALTGAVLLAGCNEGYGHKRIAAGIWRAYDNGCCNPEKGVPGTCSSEGRSIARWKRARDYEVIVYCGPPLRAKPKGKAAK